MCVGGMYGCSCLARWIRVARDEDPGEAEWVVGALAEGVEVDGAALAALPFFFASAEVCSALSLSLLLLRTFFSLFGMGIGGGPPQYCCINSATKFNNCVLFPTAPLTF